MSGFTKNPDYTRRLSAHREHFTPFVHQVPDGWEINPAGETE